MREKNTLLPPSLFVSLPLPTSLREEISSRVETRGNWCVSKVNLFDQMMRRWCLCIATHPWLPCAYETSLVFHGTKAVGDTRRPRGLQWFSTKSALLWFLLAIEKRIWPCLKNPTVIPIITFPWLGGGYCEVRKCCVWVNGRPDGCVAFSRANTEDFLLRVTATPSPNTKLFFILKQQSW